MCQQGHVDITKFAPTTSSSYHTLNCITAVKQYVYVIQLSRVVKMSVNERLLL